MFTEAVTIGTYSLSLHDALPISESAGLKERWNREKNAISRVRKLKEELDQVRQEEEKASRAGDWEDRKSTRLNSSHTVISYAVFCLTKEIEPRESVVDEGTDEVV